ncbi:NAD-P-binding protein [Vararia minispora EC-137]|uniref:NAD-P-binding protein n=1 Tax=Vararia minispora EC-137 TaxID=1314806 RepID=A0ACB8QT06_9AGAM|nr:NAD-P-binding protein [Vararia minispora EC-137]
MSGYNNFAVIGAGNVGKIIAEALLKARSNNSVNQVLVFTRPESASNTSAQSLAAAGARIVPADYHSVSSLTAALADTHVVISTLTHTSLGLQIPLAQAAKQAGVRLFVPSEFGISTDKMTDGPGLVKRKIIEQVREAGVPTTVFFTGIFADWIWQPLIGLDVKGGKVSVGGDGNAKLSFTSRLDVARFVVHALTHFEPGQLENKTIRIEAEHVSFNEVFNEYEEKSGTKLEVEYVPVEELKVKITENAHDIKSLLHLVWASGMGTVGEPVDNDKWPEWKPSRAVDYL